jgi:hypothetical protein
MKVDPYVKYRSNMEKGKKLVQTGAIFFMAAALFYLCEQLLAFRKRMRTVHVEQTPPIFNKHLVGKGEEPVLNAPGTTRGKTRAKSKCKTTEKAPAKVPENTPNTLLHAAEDSKRKRSMVGLVRSATGKMKDAVRTAAATTMAAITPKRDSGMDDDAVRLEGDGIMVSDTAPAVVASAANSSKEGSYKAPESAGTWDASTIGTHEATPAENATNSLDKGMSEPATTVAGEKVSNDKSAIDVEIPVDALTYPKSR